MAAYVSILPVLRLLDQVFTVRAAQRCKTTWGMSVILAPRGCTALENGARVHDLAMFVTSQGYNVSVHEAEDLENEMALVYVLAITIGEGRAPLDFLANPWRNDEEVVCLIDKSGFEDWLNDLDGSFN